MSLFKKAAVFTDLHVGLKSNSTLHNEDCLAFVKWFIATAKQHNCDTVIMMGDWHNNRASINIVSLHYSLQCMELLNAAFDQLFFIPGNHDLFYRDKRDITSIAWAKHLPNITIVNDFLTSGDVTICPWLVANDHKKIKHIKSKYVFGHFELPHFLMNAKVAMPDHGEIKNEDFGSIEHVFSGHFHMRQHQKNITYIGNAFPHNYADAGDDDRGLMVLEWGKEPEYHAWPDQPTYRVLKLSEAIDQADRIFKPKMHCRLQLDIDISYEEANFIKETFHKQYNLREVSLIPATTHGVEVDLSPGEVKFESVDQIVTQQITDIESQHYDKNLLLEIWHTL